MEDYLQRFEGLLNEMNVKFKRESYEADSHFYSLELAGEEEPVEVGAHVFRYEDYNLIKFIHYIDEISADERLSHYELLHTLNFSLPLGCFTINPEKDTVIFVLTGFIESVTPEMIRGVIQNALMAESVYFETWYEEERIKEAEQNREGRD